MSISSRLNAIITARNNLVSALFAKGVDASQSEGFSALVTKVANIQTGSPSLAGTLTLTGTYGNSTYIQSANCRLGYNDSGDLFVTIRSANNSSYENVYFVTGSLPSGVTLVGQGIYNNLMAATEQYYTAILTGVTAAINITCNFDSRNGTLDYVQCTVSGVYA